MLASSLATAIQEPVAVRGANIVEVWELSMYVVDIILHFLHLYVGLSYTLDMSSLISLLSAPKLYISMNTSVGFVPGIFPGSDKALRRYPGSRVSRGPILHDVATPTYVDR